MAGSLSIAALRTKSLNHLKQFLMGDDFQERLSPLWFFSLILWVGMLIATPIGIWLAGEYLFPFLATLGVIAQTITSILALSHRWSVKRILLLAAAVGPLTWLVEWAGSTTGFPFGSYRYSGLLQPQLFNVPLLIPLAWLMMLIPAWGTATIILSRVKDRLGSAYPWIYSATAGLAFTAWDLYLDPQMAERGLWIWQEPGGYFGIPWSNYFGWWLTAFLLTRILMPSQLPGRPLLVIYTLTWIFQAIGLGVFWGQLGPALSGFLGMGIFTTIAWRQVWKHSSGQ